MRNLLICFVILTIIFTLGIMSLTILTNSGVIDNELAMEQMENNNDAYVQYLLWQNTKNVIIDGAIIIISIVYGSIILSIFYRIYKIKKKMEEIDND